MANNILFADASLIVAFELVNTVLAIPSAAVFSYLTPLTSPNSPLTKWISYKYNLYTAAFAPAVPLL